MGKFISYKKHRKIKIVIFQFHFLTTLLFLFIYGSVFKKRNFFENRRLIFEEAVISGPLIMCVEGGPMLV